MKVERIIAFIGTDRDGREVGIVAVDNFALVSSGTASEPAQFLARMRDLAMLAASMKGHEVREVTFVRDTGTAVKEYRP